MAKDHKIDIKRHIHLKREGKKDRLYSAGEQMVSADEVKALKEQGAKFDIIEAPEPEERLRQTGKAPQLTTPVKPEPVTEAI